jgi:hypothetical protein
MITETLHACPTAIGPPQLSDAWIAKTAERVVTRLEGSRATWQTWQARAEAERQARDATFRSRC